MRSRIVRIMALVLSITLVFGCLTGCSANGTDSNKEVTASGTKDKEAAKDIEKEKGEDVTDANVTPDETTANVSQSNQSDSQTSNNAGNNSTGNNTITTKSNLPASSKKVSLNKQRLYERMVSIYKQPTVSLTEKLSRYDFAHKMNGTIPAQVQYIFNWYFAVLDSNGPEQVTVTSGDKDLFYNTAQNVANFGMSYSYRENEDGTITLAVTNARINSDIDRDYGSYCSVIDGNNASIQAVYDQELANYNSKIAQTNTAYNLIVDAVNKAGVAGKDETTAITNIINYICNNCVYWDAAVSQGQNKGEWIQDCLRDKHAVCNGYAKTFYTMCYCAGLDVNYYWGVTDKGDTHAWNSVKVNGTTYYFDLTWHDSVGGDTYIWASSSEFSAEHIQKGADISFW